MRKILPQAEGDNEATSPNESVQGKIYSRKDWLCAGGILVVTFVIYVFSPVHMIYDSKFLMFYAEQVLWHHTFSVEGSAFSELRSRPGRPAHPPGVGIPYQLVWANQRYYHYYPPGNVILSIPAVAVANVAGMSATRPDGSYDYEGDARIQKRLAALLMAVLAVTVFLTSRLLLSLEWSLLIAFATAFGTQIWSNASRSVWNQTWGIVILGFVIWLVVRADVKQAPLRPILLGTLLSWLYFVRPTFSIPIVAITIYVFIYQRKHLPGLVLTGAIWLAAFIGFSEYHFGQILPPYYHSFISRQLAAFGERLAGNLISPSRGLLIYVPMIGFVVYLLVRYPNDHRRTLVILSAAIVVVHLLLISMYLGWHGGSCYGPRLSADAIPWLALLAIIAVEARLRWRQKNPVDDSKFRMRAEWTVALLLIACSITLNGIGAISLGTERWNWAPTVFDFESHLWDWRHPQFLGLPKEWTRPENEHFWPR